MRKQLKGLLLKIKQKFCKHLMMPEWGLCRFCGYSDPNWTPGTYLKLMRSQIVIPEGYGKVQRELLERAYCYGSQLNNIEDGGG